MNNKQTQINNVNESIKGLLTLSDWLKRQPKDVQALLHNCHIDENNNVDESGFTVTLRFNYLD